MKIIYGCIAIILFKWSWLGNATKIPGLGCRNTLTDPRGRGGPPTEEEIHACVSPCEEECKNANEPDPEIRGFIVRLCVLYTCGNGIWFWPEIEGIYAPGCHNKLDRPTFNSEKEEYIYDECVKSCEKECDITHRRNRKDWSSEKSFIQSCIQDKCPNFESSLNIPSLLDITQKIHIHDISVIPPSDDVILMSIKEDESLSVQTIQPPNVPNPVEFEELEETEIAQVLVRLSDEGAEIDYGTKLPLPPNFDLSNPESTVEGIIGRLISEVYAAYSFKFDGHGIWVGEYFDNGNEVLHQYTSTVNPTQAPFCEQYTISTHFKAVKDLEANFVVQVKMGVERGSKYTVEDLKRAVAFDPRWNELIFVESDFLSVIFKTNPLKVKASFALHSFNQFIGECVKQRASESGHALQSTTCECNHCDVS